ncbi:hypothetical protein Mapa_000203 [Marchantia paleacea]|nr:hypothetical protein Mapa_000203 [Marchantia paleacea]
MASSIFFQGSIPQAIAEAQCKRRILVVFISGEDEESLQLEQVTWQDAKVMEEIQRGCVPLKIAGGSTDALNFSAIFPTRRVPTISIIGFTGALIQQHEGYIAPEEFVAGLQQLQNVAAAGAIATILSSAHLAQTATNAANAEDENSTRTPSHESPIEPVEDSASVSSREISSPSIERNSLSVEPVQTEMLSGAATNVPEIEKATPSARSVGEIDVDNQALEVIKAAQKAKAKKGADLKAAETPAVKTSKDKTGPFLLQIRLTNSENIRGEFEATNTLRDVKSFVDRNRTDGSKSYSFVIPFPRKSLSNDDLDKSLTQLELGPRSTVMIVPNRMTSEGSTWSCATASGSSDDVPTPAEGGGSLIARVLSYLNPFSYIRWGGSASNQETSGSDWEYDSVPDGAREADEREPRGDGTDEYTSPMNGAGPQRSSLNQRKGWGANGNVHTLRNDDDDEVFRGGNSYWNGNSTQFGGEDENKRD